MAFGSSADNLPLEKPKPLGLDPSRLDTHEQGRVLPYVAGVFRLGGTFLGEPWEVRSEEIKKKVGKKRQTIGHAYFCSFAVNFCLGPLDRLDAIHLDDDRLWEGPVTRVPGEDYLDLTIEGRGTLRLYWGTATQEPDPELAASGMSHPAYRHQCYAVFLDWSLGNRTNVPNVEIQGRRQPELPWLTVEADIGEDVNPVAVLGELWESTRYGLGLAADRLNRPLLNATAATLRAEGLGISPLITSPLSFQQVLAMLLDHLDGFLVHDPQGRLGLGLVRGTSGEEPVIGVRDLTEPPEIESGSWWDTYNEVFVRFRNRDRQFAEESVSWRDRGNYAVVGSTRSLSVSRPWVTRQKTAWLIAAALGRQQALPSLEGTLRLKKSSATALAAGSLFYLTYAPSNLEAVLCRVLEKTIAAPDQAEVTVRWREDRGYLNANLADVPEDLSLVEQTFGASAPHAARIVELPLGYTRRVDPEILFLVARGDRVGNGFNAYVETSPDSYDQAGVGTLFALRGTLIEAFPASGLREDGELEVLFDSPDRVLESVSYDSALGSGPIRVFLGDEILLGYTATLLAAGRYRIKVLRARYGTRRRSHALGAEVFVMVIGQNPPLTHELAWNPGVTTARFKVQPFLLQDELDLALCPPHVLAVQRRAYCPQPPINLRAMGDGHAPTYGPGQDLVVDWDPTSERRCFTPATETIEPQADRIVIAVHGLDGTLKGEFTVEGATGPLTILNADLVAWLGGGTDFVLRAYAERGGFRSLDPDELIVRFL